MKPENMIRLDLIIQFMNRQHLNGNIQKPNYKDILERYLELGRILNITEVTWDDQ
jgi:hypothetical protein